MNDPMTSLAFSVYAGSGIHALLLGSGISRSSGIPTGWEVVLDLIRKVAAVEGQECGGDAAAWYRSTRQKEPDYSEILAMIAKTSPERMQLLRGYFEPDEEEREAGRKAPTPAHHAIAKLVVDGYFRVIVTTNFDRLLERALESAGIVPTVIASTDSILGAAPLSQSRCTIIKVHGDYLDTRLKNTPDELGGYDTALNRLLDQVFDEYGLIVSGWSAEWDVALRNAIERCPNRRYMTYWSAYGELGEAALQLCQKRGAQVISGMGADGFFTKLAEKVAALRDIDAPHPLSARIAVATTKKYMAEEKDRIRLHDLVAEETNRVTWELFKEVGIQNRTPSLKVYEAQLEILIPMLAAGGYWGKAVHRRHWLQCFHQLVTPRSGTFPGFAVELDYYPAYLSLYAFGIASLAGGRSGNLAYILARGRAKTERGESKPLIHQIVMNLRGGLLDAEVQRADQKWATMKLPTSQYIFQRLREQLRECVPGDGRYQELFLRFEYLVGLVVAEIYQKEWDYYGATAGLYMTSRILPGLVQQEIDTQKVRWPFLRAGLFDGSLDRLRLAKAGFDEASGRERMKFGFF